ncbi:thylakoid membrane photosystem I accumulation factor [Phormidesmis sp. 146-12]
MSLRSKSLRSIPRLLTVLFSLVTIVCLLFPLPAMAGLTDDRYDGDIFALYAGNGSLVPPKISLADSLKQKKPTLLVLYTDDSSDCKQYSTVVSQFQAFYGRASDILAIRIDSLPIKDKYEPTEAGYYYKGYVPQTVGFDQSGKVVLNETGEIPYEQIDDAFRKVFDLLPREESVPLKRRQVNEVNTELVPPAPAKK